MGAIRAVMPLAVCALAAPAAMAGLAESGITSIGVVEQTSTITEFEFDINSRALNKVAGRPNASLNDFRASTEFYDVYLSDENGNYNKNGTYISILSEFMFDGLMDAKTGNNIDSVWIETDSGERIYADILASVDLGGNLSDEEFFGENGVARRILGESDGLVTYGGYGLSRFTVGFSDFSGPIVPAPSALALAGIGAMFAGRRRR